MKSEFSYKSFNSISKSNDDQNEQNSSLLINTINPNIAKLSFRVKFETKFGQSLFIIGSIEELGQWDPSKAVPMATSKDIYPTWKITKEFTCPLGMEISYKYLVKEGNNIYWEQLNNSKNQNRHIVIQSPGNIIIFDEKSNNISRIKTMVYYPMNNNTQNLSNTSSKIIKNMLSNLSFGTGNDNRIVNNNNNNNNNNFLTSNLYVGSNQSLSSYQKSIDFSTMKMAEGENEDNNYFKNFSSNNITYEYEFVNDENSINNDIDPQLELLDLCQNIQKNDKVIIVTTFLPFKIENKDKNNIIDDNDNNILNISENISNANMKFKLSINDDKLGNLILYSLKEMDICDVYWVGMLRGLEEYPENISYEISANLENQKIYVVLPSRKDIINFEIYVNKILYPLYNNLEIDINNHFYQDHDNYYTSYLNVNIKFADIIQSCMNYDVSKMVFINDIDLAFVPNYLLNKDLKANISLFVHSNFPDFDTLSLMNSNKDLLKSLLLCNTLGFHSFSQAKNFFDAIKIYFNANYKVRFDGLFCAEYMKRDIPIFIRNNHGNIDYVKEVIKNFFNKDNNNIKVNNNNKNINLLSFDTISNVYDILNKLKIFFEINVSNYLNYKYKLEMIIIKGSYSNKYLNEENEKNQKIINDNIKIIEDKLGQDFNSLFKISYIDFLPVKEQIKYFINADIFLFSDINLWNGMRTIIQEFIIVQNEIFFSKINNKTNILNDNAIINDNNKDNKSDNNNDNNNEINKIIGLIVSQNINTPEELKLITKANFSDLNDVKNILKNIITQSKEELNKNINNDMNQIKKNSTPNWIKDCLCELKKTMEFNKHKIRLKIGDGIKHFFYYPISKNIKPLVKNKLPFYFHAPSTKLFFLDLNSLLTTINNCYNEDDNYNIDDNNKINNINNFYNTNNINNINNNNSFIDYNSKIITLLTNLSNDKNNIIYLMTNKSKDFFKTLNLNPINFGYVAEDGLIVKPYGEDKFKNVLNINDNNWKIILIQLFNNYSKRIGTGDISEKDYSISWNYQNNENNNGYMIGEELKFLVENAIDKTKFDIILDKNNLEVKIKSNNKYNYIFDIIQKLVNEKNNFNFILGLNNNDKNGEEFFDYLYDKERNFKQKDIKMNLITAVIGKKTTRANCYFKDISGFIEVFQTLEIK